MSTQPPLYHQNPYLKTCQASFLGYDEQGSLKVNPSIFYPQGGGQPGDSGTVTYDSDCINISDTKTNSQGQLVLIPQQSPSQLPLNSQLTLNLDWHKRYLHMQVHTYLHLLSAIIHENITSASINLDKGRIDFNSLPPETSLESLEIRLNEIRKQNLPVTTKYLSPQEIQLNPKLQRNLNALPPQHSSSIRLVCIGDPLDPIDIQTCNGTHVQNTRELPHINVLSIKNKGKNNKRVSVSISW